MPFKKLLERRAVERKTRKIRSEIIKDLLLERGRPVCMKFGVSKVIVFGSVADGVCGEMSDLDLLVMPLSNKKYWDFRYELEEAVGIPVDLYTDRDNPVFVKKIISCGEILYEI